VPDFKTKYRQTENNIRTHNQQISEQVDRWYELCDSIQSFDQQLKDLGDKKAIEKQKQEVDSQIDNLKRTNRLSDEDVQEYKKISGEISALSNRMKEIDADLSKVPDVSSEEGFFSGVKITLSPALASLPTNLRNLIKETLDGTEGRILEEANQQVVDYVDSILYEQGEAKEKIRKIKEEHKALITKYENNIALKKLIKKSNEFVETLNTIANIAAEKKSTQGQVKDCERIIKSSIYQRKTCTENLATNIESADQDALQGIVFGVEFDVSNELEMVTGNINIRDKSKYIEAGQLKIEEVREDPGEFLAAIYSGKQKLIAHSDKKEVARDVFLLTEKILFTAEMEGDKIGGFSESTMTPGKRALFALKLIFAESEDTWPLLIDQPEDDLDSRSIYDEVVPFLKEKKRERQIIMVSHNANLVIGSDSEQIIVANRNGNDRKNEDGKQFNYLTGSLEHSQAKDDDCEDTLKSQGVCEHSCEILDGGKIAFENRKNKYHIK